MQKIELNKIKDKLKVLKQLPLKLKLALGFFSVVILVCLVALLLPLWPRVNYAFKRIDPNKFDYPVSYAQFKDEIKTSENQKPIPTENRLVIPKIDVDSEILESETLDILSVKEGVWREPFTSNPELPGNMVIAGHRFQYLPPNTNTFYNLDQMQEGDNIMVIWNQEVLIYKVYSVFEVTAEQIEIRNNSDYAHEITIYTCTPLYSSENRLVVKAYLVE